MGYTRVPLLFILYINDIVNITGEAFCNIYTDDTVLICSDGNFFYFFLLTFFLYRLTNQTYSLFSLCAPVNIII